MELTKKQQGDLGEDMGYWFVKLYLPHIYLTQFDFMVHPNNKKLFETKLCCKLKESSNWIAIEIKHKDAYEPNNSFSDFSGTGLNKYQVETRLAFQQDTGIRTLLINFEYKGDKIYYQYLDHLDKFRQYTPNGNIVVYEHKHYLCRSKRDFFDAVKNEILIQRADKHNPKISDDFARVLDIETMDEYITNRELKSMKKATLMFNKMKGITQ